MIYPLGSGPLRKTPAMLKMSDLTFTVDRPAEAHQLLSLLALITRPPPLKGFSVALQPEK